MYDLSVYHNQELEKWMNNHLGRVVSVFQITKVFAGAYLKAAIPLNAINGFMKCGIYPLNQDVFADVDYVAAEAIEMDIEAKDSCNSMSVLANPPSGTEIAESRPIPIVQDTMNSYSGPSSEINDFDNAETLPSNDREAAMLSPDIDTFSDSRSTYFGNFDPRNICPKIKGQRNRNIKKRKIDTTILTSSPYKNYLMQKKKKRKRYKGLV
ncbi:unnamed protein product [Acanthoscelides obtectus]|uniref:Uncharacterized protein n=1 Tax=Acanthoscelides obtectus TaxID=200917 RepID=A0A9P0MI29_ACAOB|nr:unnamed protein product [Acanthoscelides obtectus]CAK1651349.1 hypothetical protein AOBTE_LOCUS17210 [Acanthoscelides obtectus]